MRLVENPGYHEKTKSIENNVCFQFVAYDQDTFAEGKMIFTGLPAVTLQTLSVDEQGNSYGEIHVFDPEMSVDNRYEIQKAYANYHIRGGTSRGFDKKSYKVELLESNGSKKQSSFLGMRNDNEWCLQALYADPNRIRDKLSSELWKEISSTIENDHVQGFSMEYVELYIDDSYQGIYGLMEPVDYQQLNLDKNEDVLYKIQSWEVPTAEDFIQNQNQEHCGGAEIKDSGRMITAELWAPYQEYVKHIYNSSEQECLEFINEQMDLDNIISLGLFVDTIAGGDNKSKNTYISTIFGTGENQYTIVPWDMDLTWGLGWNGESHTHSKFSMKRAKKTFHESTFSRIWESGEYQKEICEKWETLREDILAKDNIFQKIDAYATLLNQSGAIQREQEKWTQSGCSTDVSEMKEWVETRLAYLDEFYSIESEGDKDGISE